MSASKNVISHNYITIFTTHFKWVILLCLRKSLQLSYPFFYPTRQNKSGPQDFLQSNKKNIVRSWYIQSTTTNPPKKKNYRPSRMSLTNYICFRVTNSFLPHNIILTVTRTPSSHSASMEGDTNISCWGSFSSCVIKHLRTTVTVFSQIITKLISFMICLPINDD